MALLAVLFVILYAVSLALGWLGAHWYAFSREEDDEKVHILDTIWTTDGNVRVHFRVGNRVAYFGLKDGHDEENKWRWTLEGRYVVEEIVEPYHLMIALNRLAKTEARKLERLQSATPPTRYWRPSKSAVDVGVAAAAACNSTFMAQHFDVMCELHDKFVTTMNGAVGMLRELVAEALTNRLPSIHICLGDNL